MQVFNAVRLQVSNGVSADSTIDRTEGGSCHSMSRTKCATNTSFFRALSDEALLAIALARGAPDAGGPRAVGGRRRSERGDTRPSGSYVFYFVTWARARWSLGDNAVVRGRCRGFRRAWLPAGVGDASRRFSSTCCRETCFSHLAGLFHTLEPRSDCQAALRVGGAWRAL